MIVARWAGKHEATVSGLSGPSTLAIFAKIPFQREGSNPAHQNTDHRSRFRWRFLTSTLEARRSRPLHLKNLVL